MEKVQEEADKNPIEQSVEVKSFDDPTSLLTESDDKGTSTATLADLQSEADLLSTIQRNYQIMVRLVYLQCRVLLSSIQKLKGFI